MKNILTFLVGAAVIALLVYIVMPKVEQSETTDTNLATSEQINIIESLTETNTVKTETPPVVGEENTEKQTMKAQFTTNKGSFEIELFDQLAPKTVENFVKLAESDFYNGIKFHRVIAGFMVQGGDPLTKDDEMSDRWGTGGPGYQFEDEIHAENNNTIGTISMANAGPNTNGSQFFINTAENDFLDTKHTVFGKIISGMETIIAIEAVEKFPNDRPVEPVVIESITISK